jgi:hypothetical protein
MNQYITKDSLGIAELKSFSTFVKELFDLMQIKANQRV